MEIRVSTDSGSSSASCDSIASERSRLWIASSGSPSVAWIGAMFWRIRLSSRRRRTDRGSAAIMGSSRSLARRKAAEGLVAPAFLAHEHRTQTAEGAGQFLPVGQIAGPGRNQAFPERSGLLEPGNGLDRRADRSGDPGDAGTAPRPARRGARARCCAPRETPRRTAARPRAASCGADGTAARSAPGLR